MTRFLFGFGVAFLLPVLLMLLEAAGLVTRLQLKNGRRYAIVVAFVIAAVLTPPDVISQLLLAGPLVLLYEISLVAIWFTEKKRARKKAAEDPSIKKRRHGGASVIRPSQGELHLAVDRIRRGLGVLAGAAHRVAGRGGDQTGRQRQNCEQLPHPILLNPKRRDCAPPVDRDKCSHPASVPRACAGREDFRAGTI